MSIRVIAQTNIFSRDRIEKEYKNNSSIKEILDDLQIDLQTHLTYIMVNDEKVTSVMHEVKEDALVLIKVMPTGDNPVTEGIPNALGVVTNFGVGVSDFLFNNDLGKSIDTGNGEWNIFWGTILSAVGAPLSPIMPVAGIALTYIGGALLANGSLANNTGISNLMIPYIDKSTSNFLRGGKTAIKVDTKIPIILGTNRLYPYMVSKPSISLTNTLPYNVLSFFSTEEKLYYNSLYLLGHKDVEAYADTFKFGDTPIDSSTFNSILPDITNYSNKQDFIQVNEKLEPLKDKTDYDYVTIQTSRGFDEFSIYFTFGEFYSVNSSNKRKNPFIYYFITVEELDDDGNIISNLGTYPEYRIVGHNDLRSVSYSIKTLNKLPDNSSFDSDKKYQFKIRRGVDNVKEIWEGYESRYDASIELYKNDVSILGLKCVNTLESSISSFAESNYSFLSTSIKLDTDVIPQDFNCIVALKAPVYKNGNWNTVEVTSNPASMFLYLLRSGILSEVVPDSEIDMDKMAEWYEFCETGIPDIKLECNMVLDTTSPLYSVLELIAGTGRASFRYLGKYTVIIDKPRAYPKQLITPKNSWGFAMTRMLEQELHGIKYSFIDAEAGYTNKDITCYVEGYDETTATKLGNQSIIGITHGDVLNHVGTFNTRIITRRNETITLNMDWEYVLCEEGDWVKVQHDVPLLGKASGRIIEEIVLGTFKTEELIPYESGKSYNVVIRDSSTGNQNVYTIVNQNIHSRTIEISSPTYTYALGDLISVYEVGTELGDYLVSKIEPNADVTATITLVNYAPEIYTLGTLPEWKSDTSPLGEAIPTLTKPYDLESVFNNTVKLNSSIDTTNAINIAEAVKIKESDPVLLNDEFINPTEVQLSNTYYYYVSEDLHLYKSALLPNATVIPVITNKTIKNFDVLLNDSLIVYTDTSDGNALYTFDGTTHTKIVDDTVSQPVFLNDSIILYLKDGKMYYVDVLGESSPVLFIDSIIANYDAYNNYICFKSNNNDNLWIKEFTNTDSLSLGQSLDVNINVGQIKLSAPEIVADDYTVFYRDMNSLQSYKSNVPYVGNVIKHATREDGAYLYITSEYDLYLIERRSVQDQQRRLEVIDQDSNIVIKGTVKWVGSKIIYDVSAEDLLQVSKGDEITSDMFPEGTRIIDKSLGFINVDKESIYKYDYGNIGIKGSRLMFDANRVVFPGTVTAGLLETNAISSLALTPDLLPVYRHNLNTGEQWQYDQNGRLLRTFSAENGLWLADGVKIGGTSPDDPRTTVEEAKFTDTTGIKYLQAEYPLGASITETWFVAGDKVEHEGVVYFPKHTYQKTEENPDVWVDTSAPSGAITYIDDEYPLLAVVGETWYVTDNDVEYAGVIYKKLYTYQKTASNPDVWIAIATARESVSGYAYAQNTVPTSPSLNETWYCTEDVSTYKEGITYYWNGTTWIQSGVSTDTVPIRSATPPTAKDGLLWYVTTSYPTTGTPTYWKRWTYIYSGGTWNSFSKEVQRFPVGSSGELSALSPTKDDEITITTSFSTYKVGELYYYNGTSWVLKSGNDDTKLSIAGAPPSSPITGQQWTCTANYPTTGTPTYWKRWTYYWNGSSWIEQTLDRKNTLVLNSTEFVALSPTKGDRFKATGTFSSGGTIYYKHNSYEYTGISWLSIGDTTADIFKDGVVDLTRGGTAEEPNFGLDTNGNLTARNGRFYGYVEADGGVFNGTITATGGSFSGNIISTADIVLTSGSMDASGYLNRAVLSGDGAIEFYSKENISATEWLFAGRILGDLDVNNNPIMTAWTNNLYIKSTSVGRGAGDDYTNLGVGYNPLSKNTTGSFNTALGKETLKTATDAQYCTAVGANALISATGSLYETTAIGFNALSKVDSGTRNTVIGSASFYNLESGNFNTTLGSNSGYNIKVGGDNVFIGHQAGYEGYRYNVIPAPTAPTSRIYGSNNIFIGKDSGSGLDMHETNASDYMNNNKTAIGNDDITDAYIYGAVRLSRGRKLRKIQGSFTGSSIFTYGTLFGYINTYFPYIEGSYDNGLNNVYEFTTLRANGNMYVNYARWLNSTTMRIYVVGVGTADITAASTESSDAIAFLV